MSCNSTAWSILDEFFSSSQKISNPFNRDEISLNMAGIPKKDIEVTQDHKGIQIRVKEKLYVRLYDGGREIKEATYKDGLLVISFVEAKEPKQIKIT